MYGSYKKTGLNGEAKNLTPRKAATVEKRLADLTHMKINHNFADIKDKIVQLVKKFGYFSMVGCLIRG